jgi:protein SCO1/2
MRFWWVMAIFSGLVACSNPQGAAQSRFVGAEIGVDAVAHDFHLTDHHGQLRTMQDYRGKVVAMFFGYTHCPDVCPTTMSDLAKALNLLGNRSTGVQVLFVTLDPERDTPEVLAQYVPSFDPSFVGLYGDAAALDTIKTGFRVFAHKQPSQGREGYSIDHSAGVYVFDKQGLPRLYLNYGQKPAEIASDLALLM